MATIVLKGVPDELRRRLEERARRNGRSVSGEVIACLEGAVQEMEPPRSREMEKDLLQRIRANREKMAASGTPPITDDEITAWKRQGRP
ncbi:MAG: Arc family DNA-binding protein [Deltaproteobacteria bacterium]